MKSDQNCDLRWEFIKENKKVRKQEHTPSTKKAIKKKRNKRKHALDQESDQEKTITVKKERKKENTLSTKRAKKFSPL